MKPILLLICLLFVSQSQAQEKEKTNVWKVELAGAVNNYSAWEVEPSITYQPIPYVGITAGLLFCGLVDKHKETGVSKDGKWSWTSTDDNPTSHSFALRPSVQFATPALKLGKDKDMGLSFIVSPGLTIPGPTNKGFEISYTPNRPGIWIPERFERVKNRGARSVFYHIKAMFALELDDEYILSAGYTFSDFDLYSGTRNITVEGKKLSNPKSYFIHSYFVSLGYRF